MPETKTAVEWLVEQLRGYDDKGDFIFNGVITFELIEQAKEMEKKDMIEFSQQVFRNRYNEVHQSLTKIATDTFNETYGGK
jgi:hypothetical protein